ncbi:MAG: GNAT family N-acetyltransferase [Tumebacillaceae bacterium]
MELKRAELQEIDTIMDLYKRTIQTMLASGIDQWDERYPSRDLMDIDLNDREVYWFLDDERRPVGIVVLNEYQEEEWDRNAWAIPDDRPLCVHRLVIDPQAQGQGYAVRLMEAIEQHARDNGYKSIRLDAYTGNPIACRLYSRCGYAQRGEVTLQLRPLPYAMFEKVLETKPITYK